MGKSLARVRAALTAAGLGADPVERPAETRMATQAATAAGFALGGLAPLGHLTPLPLWIDQHLMAFPQVRAAAGAPRHIFAIAPADLARVTGAVTADFCA